MSNYISAVTLASQTAVESPSGAPSGISKVVRKAAPDDQDAQVTLSPAALALSQNGSTGLTQEGGFRPTPETTEAAINAAADAAYSAGDVVAQTRSNDPQPAPHDADPHDPGVEEQTSAQVKLSTAAQVLSMSQTGASVDEIAAVLGMSVSNVLDELGVPSPEMAASSAQTTAVAAVSL